MGVEILAGEVIAADFIGYSPLEVLNTAIATFPNKVEFATHAIASGVFTCFIAHSSSQRVF